MDFDRMGVRVNDIMVFLGFVMVGVGSFMAFGLPGLLLGLGSCCVAAGLTGWAVWHFKRGD